MFILFVLFAYAYVLCILCVLCVLCVLHVLCNMSMYVYKHVGQYICTCKVDPFYQSAIFLHHVFVCVGGCGCGCVGVGVGGCGCGCVSVVMTGT